MEVATALPVVELRIQCHYFPDAPCMPVVLISRKYCVYCEVGNEIVFILLGIIPAGSAHVTGFAPSTSEFSCKCHSTTASYSSSCYKKDKRAKTGNLQTSYAEE